jgi:hypothetical protein
LQAATGGRAGPTPAAALAGGNPLLRCFLQSARPQGAGAGAFSGPAAPALLKQILAMNCLLAAQEPTSLAQALAAGFMRQPAVEVPLRPGAMPRSPEHGQAVLREVARWVAAAAAAAGGAGVPSGRQLADVLAAGLVEVGQGILGEP